MPKFTFKLSKTFINPLNLEKCVQNEQILRIFNTKKIWNSYSLVTTQNNQVFNLKTSIFLLKCHWIYIKISRDTVEHSLPKKIKKFPAPPPQSNPNLTYIHQKKSNKKSSNKRTALKSKSQHETALFCRLSNRRLTKTLFFGRYARICYFGN